MPAMGLFDFMKPACTACGEKIKGDVVEVGDAKLHQECHERLVAEEERKRQEADVRMREAQARLAEVEARGRTPLIRGSRQSPSGEEEP